MLTLHRNLPELAGPVYLALLFVFVSWTCQPRFIKRNDFSPVWENITTNNKTTTRETQCAATQFWKWCPEALYLTHPEPTKICYLQIMLFLTQLYMCEDSVSYWIWTSHSSSYVDDTISHILVSHDKSKNKYNGEKKKQYHTSVMMENKNSSVGLSERELPALNTFLFKVNLTEV